MFFQTMNGQVSLKHVTEYPEEIWIRRKTASWLTRILECDLDLDEDFFECCAWVLGNMSEFLREIRANMQLPKGRSRELTAVRSDLKRLENVTSNRACRMLGRIYEENSVARLPMRDFCILLLEKWLKNNKKTGKSIFPASFVNLFGLDANAIEICAFIWAIGNYRVAESFFEDTLSLTTIQNQPLLAGMLNMGKEPFKLILSNLQHFGIVDSNRHSMRLADSIMEMLALGKKHNIQNFFCHPVPPTDVRLSEFGLGEEDKAHIVALLGKKGKRPVHLLLYGEPGTGKTSFAARIVETLGVKAWSVACRERDTVNDRRLALMACLHLSRLHEGSIVVVDEAERLLDTDNGNLEEGSSKAWLNSLLERDNLRIIWITNKVCHLDQAVRRRFSFSAHFETPGKRECLGMWNNVAARASVGNRFPQKTREHFAEIYRVPVAVMDDAVQQAKMLTRKKDLSDCIERIIKAYLCLCQDGLPVQNNKKSSITHYNADLVCASMSPDKVLTKMKRLRREMQAKNLRGMSNLLFYGPPGTGKTAFAKHMAEKLGCNCLVQRASELLDPYVGVTEQKIAAAFAKAEKNGDLLLIDEVDSFIFSRENAHHHWEQSMVNEFLTALENFGGLCICTTNFRKEIDFAAMRRFSFKVAFNYAGPQQLVNLYDLYLAPLCASPANPDIYETLRRQNNLTPGDFKTVHSQFWLEESKKLKHEDLLTALLREQKLKLEGESKNIGF